MNNAPNERRLVPSAVNLGDTRVRAPEFDLERALTHLSASEHSDALTSGDTALTMTIDEYDLFGLPFSIDGQWRTGLGIQTQEAGFSFDENGDRVPRREDIQIGYFKTVGNYPSPHAMLLEVLEALGIENEAPEVVAIRQLLAEAATIQDTAERLQRYAEIEQKMLDDALAIPLVTSELPINYRVQPWVQDFAFPTYHNSIYHDVWFSDGAPERKLE